MTGCYGNTPEDRHFERELNKHLDSIHGEDALSFDDTVDDPIFLAESLTESEDKLYRRFVKAVQAQDAAEVGQLYLDMVDAYWRKG